MKDSHSISDAKSESHTLKWMKSAHGKTSRRGMRLEVKPSEDGAEAFSNRNRREMKITKQQAEHDKSLNKMSNTAQTKRKKAKFPTRPELSIN
jgi:hypothetical protein